LSGAAAGGQSSAEADFALAQQRVDALFTRDAQGDLLTLNELEPVPPPTPAPRIYLGLTAGGIVRGYRHDVPAALRRAVEASCEGAQTPAPDDKDVSTAIRAALSDQDPSAAEWEISAGPAYVFPETIMASEGVNPIEPDQKHLLETDFPFTAAWLRERWPCYAIIVDDRAVSICYSARRTAEVAEAGVDTAEYFRGRGYAPLVTAAWANAIRAAGITPVYSTSGDNLASQAVARKLGLRLFCQDVQVT
jgi:RimJ/RimL family protein N-acetyltransferase